MLVRARARSGVEQLRKMVLDYGRQQREELEVLRRDGPAEDEVAAARSQLKGSVVMGQESVSNRMVHLAHEELYRGAYATPEEQLERILAVTRDQVVAMARHLLSPGRFTLCALGPVTDRPLDERDWPVEP